MLKNNKLKGPIYIREEVERFSKRQLESKLRLENEEQLKKIISQLSPSNIIKFEKEDEIKFSFVGIIIIENIIIYCYPKYIEKFEFGKFKQIVQVIKKISRSKDIDGVKTDLFYSNHSNILPLFLFFIDDFLENGLYETTQDTYIINGDGEILWDRTINNNFPFIIDKQPFYLDVYTKKRINDYNDYFRQLHKIIITECSKILKNYHLDDLFSIEIFPNLTEQILTDFDDIDHILRMIKQEMNIQFNTRKLDLLEKMEMYLNNKSSFGTFDSLNIYGTSSFYFIWEKVCCDVFNDMRNIPLSNLPIELDSNFIEKHEEKDNLMSLIEKPTWSFNNYQAEADESFRPDLITIYQDTFLIIDAKYYNIKFEMKDDGNYSISGQPGIESISKQYLYELAFKGFIELHNLKTYNSFFFPLDEEGGFGGFAQLKMLHDLTLKYIRLNLNNIDAVLLPAGHVYDYFLKNTNERCEKWKKDFIEDLINQY